MNESHSEKPFWNPYLAGMALGLVLLSSFLIMGRGLGASGAANRIGVAVVDAIAPAHVSANPVMASLKEDGMHPLDDWLVFEVLGVFLGGAVAALTAGRMKLGVLKGPRISSEFRLAFALTGGILMGIAARLARGCTSGQALSGGALLSFGSWVFMFSVFTGGYALARLMKREWL
ncbi:MAG TPA: YeeE/YedE thiosulfate transporter family protein [Bdellovibrionota bacterium]|nr:YeeE/YedE thiosulfate transporter family protein [Bdellovibrionota bacterium]